MSFYLSEKWLGTIISLVFLAALFVIGFALFIEGEGENPCLKPGWWMYQDCFGAF